MKIGNSKGFTLIELLVVIGIIMIITGISSNFFNGSTSSQRIMSEIKESAMFNQLINNIDINNYDTGLDEDYLQSFGFNPGVNQKIDVFYKVNALKILPLDNSNNTASAINEINHLGIQSCKLYFDIDGNQINGKDYDINCGEINSMGSNFNLQGLILSKNIINLDVSSAGKSENELGYVYDYEMEGEEININDKANIFTINDITTNPEYFLNNEIYILSFKDKSNMNFKGIYIGKENVLGNLLKNKLIINNVNDGYTSTNLSTSNLGDILNFNHIRFFYNYRLFGEVIKDKLFNIGF